MPRRVASLAERLAAHPERLIAALIAAAICAIAFIGNGGLQLGSSTLVELLVIVGAAGLVAAALVFVGFEARLHGGPVMVALGALVAITALSILWSLYPQDSWVETNRTLAYLAAFAAGVAAVRLARARWAAVAWGVLGALVVVSAYGLATKVVPGWLASDEIYARLREPYGYWNAVGLTAAMAVPLCLWTGTRAAAGRAARLAPYPLLSLLLVTMMLSFSRGSLIVALAGTALWLALVPLRLRTLALIACATVPAAIVTIWAFGQSALSDDRVALAEREDTGIVFGLLLVAMVAASIGAGYLFERRAEEHPLSEPTRRRIGVASLCALASLPVLALGALALSDRGIGGTISDRWHDLTSEQSAPRNEPGRLIQTGNVRTIYWARALDIWREHRVAGAGAGSFAEAQLRFRDQAAQGRHAHGYVHQTLADLGLVGLAASLAALAAWLLAACRTLDLRRGRVARDWGDERTGLYALALVAVVFGLHSAIDWTWFVPAVAITGLFAAGWIAGRGPLTARPEPAPAAPQLAAVTPRLPARPVLRRRLPAAGAVVLLGLLAALAVAQPWRAQNKGDDALRLLAAGDIPQARAAAIDAGDIDPLSVEPYFERAVVESAAGNTGAARLALEHAVQTQPASSEAWRRLGELYLNELSAPDTALPLLRAALYLDPLSQLNRGAYVAALRASEAKKARRERRARLAALARERRASAGVAAGAP